MTQFTTFDPSLPLRQTNTLGVAGFVCSLAGLVLTGGLLCPVGLILSLVALGRPPRGFAVAGVILGFLGTCGGLIVFVAFGALILVALGIGAVAAFAALTDPQRTEVTLEMANLAAAIEKQRDVSGYLPASLGSLGFESQELLDPWNKPYVYTLVESKPGYDLISHGEDGRPGTEDDIALSRLDELWKGYANFKHGNGTVQFRLGNRAVIVEESKDGGRVRIESEGKTINLSGGEAGGRISVTDGDTAATGPASMPN